MGVPLRQKPMGIKDLFKPAYKSKNPEVRLKAVSRLDDQKLLAEIAMGDLSPRVRMAAVSKVNDQDLLVDIAVNGKELDARLSAVERINSQEKIAEIIKVRKNYQLMGACFARITDKKILKRIANDADYNRSARRMAIENYADESFLEEINNRGTDSAAPKSKEQIKILMDKYGGVRLVRALGKFSGSKSAITALGEILKMGGEPASIAIEYLARGLSHSNPAIRECAAEQLSSITDGSLVAKLISMIDDTELHKRIIEVLKRINHPDARQFISRKGNAEK